MLEQLVLAASGAMVRLTVAIPASTCSAQGLLEAFRYLMGSVRLQPHCVRCATWQDSEAVYYIEEWDTEEAIRDRVASERFTRLLAVLEAARESPQVEFQFVTATRGLDYVEEVRRDRRRARNDGVADSQPGNGRER